MLEEKEATIQWRKRKRRKSYSRKQQPPSPEPPTLHFPHPPFPFLTLVFPSKGYLVAFRVKRSGAAGGGAKEELKVKEEKSGNLFPKLSPFTQAFEFYGRGVWQAGILSAFPFNFVCRKKVKFFVMSSRFMSRRGIPRRRVSRYVVSCCVLIFKPGFYLPYHPYSRGALTVVFPLDII